MGRHYVVKVNDRGRIINWYPYPTQAKSLKGFLESQQGVVQGCDETLKRAKRQAETTALQDNGVNPMYIVQKGDTLWITPEGKVVRKTRPISMDEREANGAKEQEEKGQKGKDR